jgi:hypothetical protein
MRRAGIFIALIFSLLTLGRDACAQKPENVSEDAVKAAYIHKFAIFVEWPAATFATAEAPIVIGVLGDDSFAVGLGGVVDGKKINGRRLKVTKLKWNKDLKESKELKDCNLLYIAATESAHGDELVQMLKGASTLTIADFPNFARHGGIINFISEDGSVRFEVNPEAAKKAELNISSQLLSIAKIVRTEQGGR